jgi:hypothetical protein
MRVEEMPVFPENTSILRFASPHRSSISGRVVTGHTPAANGRKHNRPATAMEKCGAQNRVFVEKNAALYQRGGGVSRRRAKNVNKHRENQGVSESTRCHDGKVL